MPENVDGGIAPATEALDHRDPATAAYRASYGPTRLRFAVIVVQAWLCRAARWTMACVWSPEDQLESDREFDQCEMCRPHPRA
jgi:hypothetical protein